MVLVQMLAGLRPSKSSFSSVCTEENKKLTSQLKGARQEEFPLTVGSGALLVYSAFS